MMWQKKPCFTTLNVHNSHDYFIPPSPPPQDCVMSGPWNGVGKGGGVFTPYFTPATFLLILGPCVYNVNISVQNHDTCKLLHTSSPSTFITLWYFAGIWFLYCMYSMLTLSSRSWATSHFKVTHSLHPHPPHPRRVVSVCEMSIISQSAPLMKGGMGAGNRDFLLLYCTYCRYSSWNLLPLHIQLLPLRIQLLEPPTTPVRLLESFTTPNKAAGTSYHFKYSTWYLLPVQCGSWNLLPLHIQVLRPSATLHLYSSWDLLLLYICTAPGTSCYCTYSTYSAWDLLLNTQNTATGDLLLLHIQLPGPFAPSRTAPLTPCYILYVQLLDLLPFAYGICFYGIYFYGIYIYVIYFYTALKFLNIDLLL
jgi:hypothetical protein